MMDSDDTIPPEHGFDESIENDATADGSTQSEVETVSPIEEAKAAAMSIEVRALDGAEYEAAPENGESASAQPQEEATVFASKAFPTGDTLVPPSNRFRKGEWQHEFSGHKIAVELARVESDVRKIMDERDPKRKRKFTGTRRWQELEEDVIAMKFSGRMDETVLRELTRLVMQRHFLFGQLRFVATTRPTWNT